MTLWGWPSLHAIGPKQIVEKSIKESTVTAFKDLLFGKRTKHIFNNLEPLNKVAQQQRDIKTTILGGNLSLVQTSIGTPWQLEGAGKIILLEDRDERSYSIDRMLVHLSQAGVFKGAEAILFGDFIEKEEPDGKYYTWDIIKEFAELSSVPVLKIPGIGHSSTNLPLPLGYPVALTLGKSPSLSFAF